jgi:hypothetical protein
VGNLETRISKLETVISDTSAWDLTLLTDAELIDIEACLSRAEQTGEDVRTLITPELVAALERVKR